MQQSQDVVNANCKPHNIRISKNSQNLQLRTSKVEVRLR